MSEPPVTACRTCGAPVQRVFHPIAVHFKGSGFYNTDYGTSKRKREMDASAKAGADKHDAKSKDKKDVVLGLGSGSSRLVGRPDSASSRRHCAGGSHPAACSRLAGRPRRCG